MEMMMAIKTFMIAGAMVVAAGVGSARAAPITYVGDYSSDLVLTITTDGAMGEISAADILSFDIKSSAFPDGSFDNSSGDIFFMGGFEATGPAITASSAGLEYDFGMDDYNVAFEGEGAANGNDLLIIQSDGGFVGGSGFYVSGSADPAVGTLITESGPTIIAAPTISEAPVSAAPEPAGWSLMICGLALVGGALRLGRRGGATVAC